MRTVIISPNAEKNIYRVADFVELINMPESGDRWFNKLMDFIQDSANTPVKTFPFCNNLKLALSGYSCFVFNKKWIIVFRYTSSTLTVYRFVLGAKLK